AVGVGGEGKVGNEEDGMSPGGPGASDDLRAIALKRHAVAAIGRQTMESMSNGADTTARRGTPQLGQRKPRTTVLGSRIFAIDADVGDAQVVILARLPRINLVEFGGRIIGRSGPLVALVGLIGRSSG